MSGSAPRRVHAYVSGRVQGVWYRGNTEAHAQALGLAGWVRNLADGRVEFVAEGPSDRVQQLIDWAHRGPPDARVERVEVHEEDPGGEERAFEVRF